MKDGKRARCFHRGRQVSRLVLGLSFQVLFLLHLPHVLTVMLFCHVVCFWCSTLVFNGASLEALRHIADHQADVESTKHGLLGELCYRGAEGSHHFGQKWLEKHELSQPH